MGLKDKERNEFLTKKFRGNVKPDAHLLLRGEIHQGRSYAPGSWTKEKLYLGSLVNLSTGHKEISLIKNDPFDN